MVLTTCSMCLVPVEEQKLMQHIVAVHKFEPGFLVHCSLCGASYNKWDSFVKHLRRKHKHELHRLLGDEENDSGEGNDHDQRGDPDNPVQGNNNNDTPAIPMEVDLDEGAGNAEHMTMESLAEWQAVTFFGSLQEEKMLPKNTAEEIVNDVNDIVRQQIKLLQDAVLQGLEGGQAREHINEVFEKALHSSTFKPVNSTYLHKQYLKKNCNLVMPEKTVLGPIRFWSSDGKVVETHAYVVPFLRDLETLLNNKDILDCVENPRQHKPGVFSSLLDGLSYRNHAEFKRNPKALSIVLYYDDVEFCNPLGSKKRKLAMFYYILGNIHPELRSTLRVVNLLAIVDNRHLKKFGAKKVFEPFLTDMKKLSSGVELTINKNKKYFSGFLQAVLGDTPAASLLAGFKEGVGGATRPCRKCLVLNNELCDVISEEQVVLRDEVINARLVCRATNPELNQRNRNMWSALYGVNGECCFLDLEGFDKTQGFPQDFMHVVIEGPLEAMCRNFISYCVNQVPPIFTLDNLNSALSSFKYGHLIKDKPSPIDSRHLENGLKQSAAQLLTLLFVLPFAVYQWTNDLVEEHVHSLIVLGQIVNLSLAFELTSEDVPLLKKNDPSFYCFLSASLSKSVSNAEIALYDTLARAN